MPRRKVVEEFDIADAFRTLAQQVEQHAEKPNILGYVPHKKQEFFHASQDYMRLYLGGNRSGKTYGAVVEDIWWCTKTHPYRKMPPGKIRGRVVAVDLQKGVEEILIPLFKSLMVPSMMVNGKWEDTYSEGKKKLTFSNGSTIEFMSYEQDTAKFAGTSRHFVHYDEEPPKNIFNECQARLVDTRGSSWISMTPVEGATWVFDDKYEPAFDSEDKEILQHASNEVAPVWRSAEHDITVIEVGTNENPHLDAEARERYFRDLDEDERKARSKGTFVTIGGKVFKSFTISTHVLSEDVDPADLQRRGWQIYSTTDHGWNNPTAWLWMAVAPGNLGGNVITFGEHYATEMTIAEHAQKVILMETAWGLDREEIVRTGDPAMHQHSGITGTTVVQEYAKHGLYIYTDSVPKDRGIGIARMQQYFRVLPNGRPKWMIHESCTNLVRELKKLKWEQRASKKARDSNNKSETVHKYNDHAFDAAKYFATFLDELEPEDVGTPFDNLPKSNGILSYDDVLNQQYVMASEASAESMWTTLEGFE